MNLSRHSIVVRISALFGLTLIFIVGIAIAAFIWQHKWESGSFLKRSVMNPERVREYVDAMAQGERKKLDRLEIEVIRDDDLAVKISLQGERLELGDRPPRFEPHEHENRDIERIRHEPPQNIDGYKRTQKPFGPRRLNLYLYNGERYLIVSRPDGQTAIIRDLSIDGPKRWLFFAFFISLLAILSALYLAVLRSLRGIGVLQHKIKAFGNGNFQVDTASREKDEIAQIANEFDAAAKRIGSLIEARELFLKNAAHELKTPIAKGVVTTHLLEDGRNKELLLMVFTRLNSIVDALVTVELLSAGTLCPKKEVVKLEYIIQKAIEELFLEDDTDAIECDKLEDAFIMADSELFCVSFKNLLDNAVKFCEYGSKVRVYLEGEDICISNYSQSLTEPIDRYFEPFSKETSERNVTGMGLGLYIAKKLLAAQGFTLSYSHENGQNIFKISQEIQS